MKKQFLKSCFAIAVLLSSMDSANAALKATYVSRVTYPYSAKFQELSCLTWSGFESLYYSVDDKSNFVCSVTIPVDTSTGKLPSSSSSVIINPLVQLSGVNDPEGCAFDPYSACVWVSDESSSIREFSPLGDGKVVRTVPVPPIFKSKRGNFGFEPLTISGDGLTMWTSNEEALSCDGPISTVDQGTVVRIAKFTRESVRDNWTAVGQWAYQADPLRREKGYKNKQRSGISGMVALPDGTLLVLEREMSGENVSLFGTGPDELSFRCRIYAVDFSEATEVSSYSSLDGTDYSCVKKLIVYDNDPNNEGSGSWDNYEGICLGPRLDDNSVLLLLISDGGSGANRGLMSLKLTGLGPVRDIYFDDSEDGTAEPVGGPYRYIDGQTVTATVKSLAGNPYESDLRVQPFWSAPEHGAQGLGATAEFTVMANDRVTWNVVTNDTLPLLATDSFERYAVGTEPSGMAAGWSGDGIVAEASYSPATPPGYPLQNETHTRVLMVDGDALRSYAMLPGDGTRFDTMLRVTRQRADSTLPSPDPATDRLMLFFDLNGQPVLRHLAANGSGIVDTKLSDRVFADGDWVRVSITLESGGGAVWCQTLIDGEPAYTAAGVRAPDDWRSPGSWHRCLPGAGSNSRIASVLFRGTGAVDDLMLAETARAFEFDELSGSARTNGVPKKWLSEQGLPYDVRIDADGDGFSSFDEYLVGTDPWSEAEGDCFRILDAGFLENGQYQMLFLGRRDRADFAVFASDSLDAPVEEWNAEVNRPVASGTGTNRWTSLVAPAGAARFYAPRATLAD